MLIDFDSFNNGNTNEDPSRKRKQSPIPEETTVQISKRTRSDIIFEEMLDEKQPKIEENFVYTHNENLTIENGGIPIPTIQTQENVTLDSIPELYMKEEEANKKKEKKEELKNKKIELLKRKLELFDSEINLLDRFIETCPSENRTIVEPLPPVKVSKPKKKASKKQTKKDTPKKDKQKKESKKDSKKSNTKKEVKKEGKKEIKKKKETSTKKETNTKKEVPKKEVKKEAIKKEVKKEVTSKKEAPKKASKNKGKGKTQGLSKCKEILETLMNDPLAPPFNQPVDPIALNIPSYPLIIKEPMDFGTIKRTLDLGQYTEVSEFIADIELVFDNCWKFNGYNSDIGDFASHLSNLFKSLSQNIDEDDDDDFAPSSPQKKKVPKKKPGSQTKKKTPSTKNSMPKVDLTSIVSTTPVTTRRNSKKSEEDSNTQHMEETIKNLQSSMKSIEKEVERLKKEKEILEKNNKKVEKTTKKITPAKKKTPTTSKNNTKNPPKKEDARPMNLKEKHELSVSINNLDPENLGEVVKIISERMPELANNTAPDEIEIDIDALDAITLRHLERFVKSCQIKRRRKKSTPNVPAENLTLEDKQLKVVEAAHATSSNIRNLERELASMEGRPVPPPIDVPLAVPLKKPKVKENTNNTKNEMESDDDSISDSDLMSSSDENDELQVVPSNIPSNSVSFNVQSDLSQTHLLSDYHQEKPSPKQESPKKVENNVVIKNFDQWNLGDEQDTPNIPSSDSNPPFDKSGELWKKLQNRETINKQKERERELMEEKIKLEKEKIEREKREKLELIEREKREKERKLYEEQEREREEQERKREEERLRLLQELEQSEKTVNLQDQHDMIEDFEKSLGLPYN